MKNSILILILALSTCTLSAQKVVVDKVIGVVGDNTILLSDIENQMQQARQSGEVITDDMRCQAFDGILLEKFFLAQAQLDSVYVSEDEVEAELDKRIRYFISSTFGSQQKLEEYYGKSVNELKEDFRKDIKNQMLAEKMQSKIFANIKTTPADVKGFYDQIPKDSLPFFNAEIELAQIVIFPKVSPELKEYAYQSIKKIREDILKGDDFATKARLYSDDPGSKKEGGDLGFITRGEMVPEFEAAAFRLEEGKMSDVIETKYGYHIVQCLEKKGEKVHVRHILISPKTTSFDEQQARIYLDSIRALIIDKSNKINFEDGVKEYSEDDQSKSNLGRIVNPASGTSYFEMNQIDAPMLYAINGLKVGDLSNPVPFESQDGRSGFRVVKLISETQPHQANLKEDYTKIQAAARQAKQQEALVKWIKDRKNDTYLYVDEFYKECENIKKWLSTSAKSN